MMRNNIRIAVTGGMGSGKSTVVAAIKEMGYDTISCDEVYAELTEREELLAKLSDTFGDVLAPDGKLDRKKLSDIVFGDKLKLQKLNDITHSAVMNEVLSRSESSDICFCEVPLLFEGGFQRLFDAVIVVLRDKEKRIDSVIKRDNIVRNEVELRMGSQFNYDNSIFSEYYVIHNDGTFAELTTEIHKVVKKILNNCSF